jgi:hypothetical protein
VDNACGGCGDDGCGDDCGSGCGVVVTVGGADDGVSFRQCSA